MSIGLNELRSYSDGLYLSAQIIFLQHMHVNMKLQIEKFPP